MNPAVKEYCDQLIANYRAADTAFLMEHSCHLVCGSLMYLNENREVDPALLKECRKLLRKEESAFSYFRGSAELSVVFLMSLAEEPLTVLKQLEHVIERLSNIWSMNEVLSAAVAIISHASPFEFDEKAARTRELLEMMKQDHPFLTAQNDLPFAALLAVNEEPGQDLLAEAEECYRLLRKHVTSSHEFTQILSLILSIYPASPADKCGRINEIALGYRKIGELFYATRIDSILGILAQPDGADEEIVSCLQEADQYLSDFFAMKGSFGNGYANRRISEVLITALLFSSGKRLSPAAVSVMFALFANFVQYNC